MLVRAREGRQKNLEEFFPKTLNDLNLASRAMFKFRMVFLVMLQVVL